MLRKIRYIIFIFLSFVNVYPKKITIINETDRPATIRLKSVTKREDGTKIVHIHYKNPPAKLFERPKEPSDIKKYNLYPDTLAPHTLWKVDLASEGELSCVRKIRVDFPAVGCFELTRSDVKALFGLMGCGVDKDVRKSLKSTVLAQMQEHHQVVTTARLKIKGACLSSCFLIKRKASESIGTDRHLFEIVPVAETE